MKTIKNIKTGVIKEIAKDFELSMYLSTKEWVLVEKEEPKKVNNSFKKNV